MNFSSLHLATRLVGSEQCMTKLVELPAENIPVFTAVPKMMPYSMVYVQGTGTGPMVWSAASDSASSCTLAAGRLDLVMRIQSAWPKTHPRKICPCWFWFSSWI
eukprot:Skav209237  [mRNA]  locus=scaffold293:418239:420807:- [translate_table: standard]